MGGCLSSPEQKLFEASQFGQLNIVEGLLKKPVDINAKVGPDGKNALTAAATNGEHAIVKLLLEHGAELEGKCRGGTALKFAIMGSHCKTVELLINAKANIETRDEDNQTPLIMACIVGNVEIATLLIDKGADIDAEQSKGWNALYWATSCKNQDCIDLLVSKGAVAENKA
jgi:ankyrin repeat protein